MTLIIEGSDFAAAAKRHSDRMMAEADQNRRRLLWALRYAERDLITEESASENDIAELADFAADICRRAGETAETFVSRPLNIAHDYRSPKHTDHSVERVALDLAEGMVDALNDHIDANAMIYLHAAVRVEMERA